MPGRFDIDRLDPEDPFEIDEGNRPHLYKHLPTRGGRHVAVGVEDLYDLYLFGNPIFYPADRKKGDAHWLMVGEVPGMILVVPLAPPNSSHASKCRPIGIDAATEPERRQYLKDVRTL
jgi:hypothetical protein